MNYIFPDDMVTAYLYGNTVELSTSMGNRKAIVKIDEDHYFYDGEVREYKHKSRTRSDNLKSVRKTMNAIRRLITANFDGSPNELWVTLTYADNVTDTKKVYHDFRNFMKRLRQSHGDDIEYLSVLEPQERGAWHCHVLIKKMSARTLYISNNDMFNYWKKGFVKVKRLKQSDNVSAYLMAYLMNVPLDDDEDSKKFIKGGRLRYYPANMNIYRSSRGIIKPKPIKVSKRKLFADYAIDRDMTKPDYFRDITVPDSDFTIKQEFFDLRKKKGVI